MKFQSLTGGGVVRPPSRHACRNFGRLRLTPRKASGRVGTAYGTVRSSGRAAVQSWGRLDMSATGLDVFYKTLPTTNIWLDEIMGEAWARPTGGMNTRGEMPCKSVKR